MSNIVLLEIEEDLRLAAQIVAKNRGIFLKVYADYADYKNHTAEDDKVCSSDESESRQHNFHYIKKPYTAHQLLELISTLG